MTVFPEEIYALILSHYTPSNSLGQTCIDSPEFLTHEGLNEDIFETWESSYRDLTNICLVSKAFHRLGRPILYRTYVAAPDDYDDYPNSGLKLFLRSLLENPVLQSMIENVSLVDWTTIWGGKYSPRRFRLYAPTNDIIALYDEVVPTMHVNSGDMFARLKRGHHDEEIGLLLALCPNIKLLSITAPMRFASTLLMRTLCQHWHIHLPEDIDDDSDEPQIPLEEVDVPEDQRFLSKLETLSFAHWDTEMSAEFNGVLPFVNLPKLKRIYGNQLNLNYESLGRALPPSQSSKLAHLHLTNSLWNLVGLRSLLDACQNLESLGLHGGGAVHGDMELDVPGLGDVIRGHAKSIKRLSFDPHYTDDWNEQHSGGTLGQLGDLRTLSKLEYITAPLFQLISKDDLPCQQDYNQWTMCRIRDGVNVEFEPSASMTTAHRLLLPILPDSIKDILFIDHLAPTSVMMSFKSSGAFTVKHIVENLCELRRLEESDFNYEAMKLVNF